MEMALVAGGLNLDITMGRKITPSRRVIFAAIAQHVRVNYHLKHYGFFIPAFLLPTPNTPSAETPPARKSPAPTRRANGKEIGDAVMELDEESPNRGDVDNGFGFAGGQPFGDGECAGNNTMDLTDTYQPGASSRRLSSALFVPLLPLGRSISCESKPERNTDNDKGEFLVKAGEFTAPRRKNEIRAELQSMARAGADEDEDYIGSTAESDSNLDGVESPMARKARSSNDALCTCIRGLLVICPSSYHIVESSRLSVPASV
ncbi:hypothetical protein FRC09_011013 [Ceratobasidium sp. 395]|nr:hypothetical protein FRC09_011013 [Ceratobasidium sp. 395]